MQLTDIRIKLCDTHGSFHGSVHGRLNGSANGNGHSNMHGEANGNVRSNRRPFNAAEGQGNRLKAFCALTFDGAFVIRDVKLIEGNDGLFVAMPSRKICDRCPRCGDKNHLRARYCNNCGARLDENRGFRAQRGQRPALSGSGAAGFGRVKLHADIAHPINADCRQDIEQDVLNAYWREVEKSRLPGYVPPNLDGEDVEFPDSRSLRDEGGDDAEREAAPLPIDLPRGQAAEAV